MHKNVRKFTMQPAAAEPSVHVGLKGILLAHEAVMWKVAHSALANPSECLFPCRLCVSMIRQLIWATDPDKLCG